MSNGSMCYNSLPAEQLKELQRWALRDFREEPDEQYVSESAPIVVCGCGRSGTTLARVILDTHSCIYSGPESLLFLPTPISTSELAWKFGLEKPLLDDCRAGSSGRAEFIDRFQQLLLREAGKSLWADKTARNVHRLGYILRHFPRARVIHVVRDARDVVASLRTHRKRRVVDSRIELTGFRMPLEPCIDRWERAIRDALPFRQASNYYEISYERIVTDTERAVREMCDFLGADFEPEMLDFHLVTGPTRDQMKFPQNIEATQPITPAPIGRYRSSLTAAEIDRVETRLAGLMELCNMSIPPKPRVCVPLLTRQTRTRDPLVIRSAEIEEVIGSDLLRVKEWTREAFRLHYEKAFIQPPKSYLVTTTNPYDRIIALPAAVTGAPSTLGIKWIGSHSQNHQKGFERAHAVIILNDPETHAALVLMDGTLISSLRTLAVTLLALDRFAPRPHSIGILGMGKLGRLHARVLGDLYPSIRQINCFSRHAPFDDLLDDSRLRKGASAGETAAESEVIITASAATEPYIHSQDLSSECRLIVNLSLMDCHAEVIAGSDHVVVDDLEQNLRADRVFKTAVERGLLERERVDEFGAVLFGPPKTFHGRVFFNPLGMGLEDVHVAGCVARRLGVYP